MLYFKLCVGDSHMCKSNLFTPLINYERAKASKADTGAHIHAHRRHSATQLVWMRNARTIMNMNVVHVRAGLCACVYGMWHVSADYITCITCQRNRAAQQQNKNRKEEDRKEKSLNNGTKQCTRVNFFERGVRLLHTHTRTFWGQRDLRSISFYCVVRAQVNEMYSTAVDRKAAPPHNPSGIFRFLFSQVDGMNCNALQRIILFEPESLWFFLHLFIRCGCALISNQIMINSLTRTLLPPLALPISSSLSLILGFYLVLMRTYHCKHASSILDVCRLPSY